MPDRKSFYAGYLWCSFLFDWDVSEIDLDQADKAYIKWLEHLARKEDD